MYIIQFTNINYKNALKNQGDELFKYFFHLSMLVINSKMGFINFT